MARVRDQRRPLLVAPLPVVWVGDGALAWSGRRAFALHRATALVLSQLDGAASIDELVGDACAVLGLADGDDLVRHVVSELETLSRASVVDLELGEGELGGGSQVETLATEVRHGVRTTHERLPDGRIRRTASLTLTSTDSTDQIESLLRGTALTDVLQHDSCVGSKLRAGEPAFDLLVDVADGHTRVRVDHQESLVAIRELLGDAIVDEVELTRWDREDAREQGAARAGVGVSAYVVAPLDGVGPPRVYDQWAARAGRPDGAAEVAQLVGHLVVGQLADGARGVPVRAFAVRNDQSVILMSEPLRDLARLHRKLRRAGLQPLDARRLGLHGDGSVEVSDGWPGGSARRMPVLGVLTLQSGSPQGAELDAGVELLASVRAGSADTILPTLRTVASAIASTTVVGVEHDCDSVLDAVTVVGALQR